MSEVVTRKACTGNGKNDEDEVKKERKEGEEGEDRKEEEIYGKAGRKDGWVEERETEEREEEMYVWLEEGETEERRMDEWEGVWVRG